MRTVRRARTAAEAATSLTVAPLAATHGVRRRAFGPERAHQDIAERAARWTGRTGEARRLALYRRLGLEIGDHAVLRAGCLLLRPPVAIGAMTVIGHQNVVQRATIGADCLLGTHVQILDGTRQHRWDRTDLLIREQPELSTPVTIGDDVFIGPGALVFADVGDHAVVTAGSVVFRPVPAYAIVSGSPARQVGDRRETAERTASAR